MVPQSIDEDTRRRCEFACQLLAQAIVVLDGCGFDDPAAHAHLCLELVRDALDSGAGVAAAERGEGVRTPQ